MNIRRLLISRMAETYYPPHKGMNTRTLCKITPAYSQRFGEWKQEGIIVEKMKNDDGHTYTYHLRTDPTTFDWDTLRAVIPRERIRRTKGKVEKKDDGQEVLL